MTETMRREPTAVSQCRYPTCSSKLIECGTCYGPYSYGIDNALQSAHTQQNAVVALSNTAGWEYGKRTALQRLRQITEVFLPCLSGDWDGSC